MPNLGKTAVRLPRGYAKGDIVEVKTRILHPNHNGRRRVPDTDLYIAEYYVNRIDVFYGGERVVGIDTSGAIAQNPYFTFTMRLTHSAPLRVVWKDTKGKVFEDTVEVRV